MSYVVIFLYSFFIYGVSSLMIVLLNLLDYSLLLGIIFSLQFITSVFNSL